MSGFGQSPSDSSSQNDRSRNEKFLNQGRRIFLWLLVLLLSLNCIGILSSIHYNLLLYMLLDFLLDSCFLDYCLFVTCWQFLSLLHVRLTLSYFNIRFFFFENLNLVCIDDNDFWGFYDEIRNNFWWWLRSDFWNLRN